MPCRHNLSLSIPSSILLLEEETGGGSTRTGSSLTSPRPAHYTCHLPCQQRAYMSHLTRCCCMPTREACRNARKTYSLDVKPREQSREACSRSSIRTRESEGVRTGEKRCHCISSPRRYCEEEARSNLQTRCSAASLAHPHCPHSLLPRCYWGPP
jgi:hypothetical protein